MTPSDARNAITAYAQAETPELRAICDQLQAEIGKAIPTAASRIWHGSPVWFLGENPAVGYSVKQKRVDLMFWSGQLFDEPRLKAVGKDKAAQVSYDDRVRHQPPRTPPLAQKSRHNRFRLRGDVPAETRACREQVTETRQARERD